MNKRCSFYVRHFYGSIAEHSLWSRIWRKTNNSREIRRIIFDFLRSYASNIVRMWCLQQSELDRMVETLPFIILVMTIIHILGSQYWEKFYTQNKWIKSVLNVEYQYGKSINYIKLMNRLLKMHPQNPIFWWFVVDLVEGYATNSVYALEKLIFESKLDWSSLIRNTKVYGLLNMITILHYIFAYESQYLAYSFETSNRTVKLSIFIIIFIAVWDKLQKSFKEETIVEKLLKFIFKYDKVQNFIKEKSNIAFY